MSYHNIQIPAQSNTNTQGEAAPVGYHYMPDGTLMSDAKHGKLYGGKIKEIESFNLDLSDIKQAGETRPFSVNGWDGAAFSLEIKNDAGQYYNFVTDAFQTIRTRLENKTIRKGSYSRDIVFPSDNDGNQYDIYLFAELDTEHTDYNEVRFGDGSIDINSSTGTGSLLLQKVIYQYADLTLTLSPFTPSDTIEVGTVVSDTVTVSRGLGATKASFTISFAVNTNTKAYQIIKQPASSDVLAFINPTVGAAPITIPGENIYPTITDTGDVNGTVSSSTSVTLVEAVADVMAVGDKVTGTGISSSTTVTVVSLDSTNVFTVSEAVSISGGVTLSFYNQMNYQWPFVTGADLMKPDMIMLGTSVTAGSIISKYQDTITIFPDTEDEKVIIKYEVPAVDTLGKKPTIVKGLVTVQEGTIAFNNQQVLALAGTTPRVGGYGENEINRIFGYDVKLTNLKIALTEITTTTTSSTIGSASTSVAVSSRNGILDDVSTVSGIGINPLLANPTVDSGAGAVSGAGTIVLTAAQELESGITLTFAGAGQAVTITGEIEILKAGIANQTLRFDVDKLLSIT